MSYKICLSAIWTMMVKKAIVHRDSRITFAFCNESQIITGAYQLRLFRRRGIVQKCIPPAPNAHPSTFHEKGSGEKSKQALERLFYSHLRACYRSSVFRKLAKCGFLQKETAHRIDTPWYQIRCAVLAGAERLELPTRGFGDRCSTKLSYTP